MRPILSLALGLLTAAAAFAGGHLHRVAGAAAPDLRPFPADAPRWNADQPLSWGQFRGKVVWLDFWNHR